MSDQTNRDDTRRRRLDEVIGSFLIALDAGQGPDPQEWMARYPDLCPELADFFADRRRVDALVEPMRGNPDLGLASPIGDTLDLQDSQARRASSPSGSTPGALRGTPAGPSEAGTVAGGSANPGVGRTTESDDASPPPLLRGTQVRYFGDYELERVLGEGGMGIVYKARQLSLNRSVALKLIRAARFASGDDLRRFRNEAEAVARLDHPNIVPIFEVGHFDEQHYFSMKLIRGEGLDKRLKEYLADPRRAARLVATTAEAIHHAHQRGILHRDLKPANVLVDAEGQPHVTDFGLAKRVEGDSELTQTGAILGTPTYMAPEQTSAKKGAITTATDVYGLGAILYALLTGRGPFSGTTVMETLDHVRQRVPDPLRSINPRVPRDLEVICLKCLEKDPRRRYSSADAMADDLKRWLAGEPIAARPVSNAARLGMWCRRNPALASALALAAVALVAAVAVSLLYANHQARHAEAQFQAAQKINALAGDLEAESHALRTSLDESNRRLARLQFTRSQMALDQGDIGRGLLWLVASARAARASADAAWERCARANLAAWRPFQPDLQAVMSHRSPIDAVAFSPDGKIILTGGRDGIGRLWDASTGQLLERSFPHPSWILDASFSPDGRLVLTACADRTARLWDAATGQPIGRPLEHAEWVTAAMFSPDGKTIWTCSGQVIRSWSREDGRPIGNPISVRGYFPSIILHPDRKTALIADNLEGMRRWDLAAARPVGPSFQQAGRFGVRPAVSPDGRFVLALDDQGKPRVWHSLIGTPFGEPFGSGNGVVALAFSPDGQTIAIASVDHPGRGEPVIGVTRRWHLATRQPVGLPIYHPAPLGAMAFSPDGGSLLIAGEDGTARLWSTDERQPIGRPVTCPNLFIQSNNPEGRVVSFSSNARTLSFSPDGRTLVTAGPNEMVGLWDATALPPAGRTIIADTPVRMATMSPDGKAVLIADQDGMFGLWDVATGRPFGPRWKHGDGWVSDAAISPDRKTIVTGGRDRMARLWDVASGQPIGHPLGHRGEVHGVAFSPDGKIVLTGSNDRTARLWDAATGQEIGRPFLHPGAVLVVAFAPDGKVIGTGCQDRTARLWDVATGQPLGRPMSHPGGVRGLAFTPDGKSILVGGSSVAVRPDGTAAATTHFGSSQLWDIATGQPIGPGFPPDPKLGPDPQYLGNLPRLWNLDARLPDDLDLLACWIETLTGLEIDEQGAIRVLDHAAWTERRQRLQALGGPPATSEADRFDPILFGWNPLGRANGLGDPGQSTRAQEVLTDVIRYRPDFPTAWAERGRLSMKQMQLMNAVADLQRAADLIPGDALILSDLAKARWMAGDLEGYRSACAQAVRALKSGADRNTKARVVETCCYSPNAVADRRVIVHLAESVLKESTPQLRYDALYLVGTALYRVGRYNESIRSIEEAIRVGEGVSAPEHWPFLAMAHFRLGHRDEARRWLDMCPIFTPSSPFEAVVEMRRREAEAVILHDPAFPEDPFAP